MAVLDKIRDAASRVLGGGVPALDRQQMEFLDDAADMGSERVKAYERYEAYYSGQMGVPLLERAKQYLQRSGQPYTENFCETIVLEHKRRLKLEGFQVQDDETASDWLTNTWFGRSRGDRLQGIVHLETLKLGDGFVIVDWDEKRSRPRATWNHPSKIKPVYDEDGNELLHVNKVWTTSKVSEQNPSGIEIRRLNLYFPDRVEKWFSPGRSGGLWAPWLDATDEAGNVVWPTPWTTTMSVGTGEPLGIPAFHFKEQPGAGVFGRSILHGVIPQQDGLDKQSADLFYVMDLHGWPWPYISGLSDKQREALSLAIGEIVTLPENASMGSLDAADPRLINDSIEAMLARMAVRSATPIHALITSGDQPSGESRKMAESATVAAALDRHVYIGNAWEDVSRMCNLLGSVFGEGVPPIDPETEIDAVWDSPETRDDKLEAETLLIHQELGASKATTLRRAGYDPNEEAELRAEETKADPLTGRLIDPPDGSADDERPAGGTGDDE